MRVRLIAGGVAVPIALIGVLGVEALLANRVERLEPFSRAELDGRVGGNGSAPLRLTWLGDSTGDGVGASTVGATLPRLVAAGLGRPVELTVLAKSGARVQDVIETQLPELAGTSPDWVVVCIGGNDVTHLTSRPAFRARMTEIVRAARGVSSRVIVVGIGEFAATPLLAQPLRMAAGWRADMLAGDQREIARTNGATFVDIINATGQKFVTDPKRYHARDGFHPSDDGYRLWAEAVLAAIG